MARTTIKLKVNYDEAYVTNMVNSVLLREKYKFKTLRGENVWSKGDGIILKQSCFLYWFKDGDLFVQAWIYDGLTGESTVDGVIGLAVKKKMKSILAEIEKLV